MTRWAVPCCCSRSSRSGRTTAPSTWRSSSSGWPSRVTRGGNSGSPATSTCAPASRALVLEATDAVTKAEAAMNSLSSSVLEALGTLDSTQVADSTRRGGWTSSLSSCGLRMPACDVAARHGRDARWRKQIPGARGHCTDDREQIDPVAGRVRIRIKEVAVETGLLVEDVSSQGSSRRSSRWCSTSSQRPLMRSDRHTSMSRISSSNLRMTTASWCSIAEDRGRRGTTANGSRMIESDTKY
jgi:hypothetical protein